ncbi:hypothetical protein QFZ75_000957 [Streptomyces sp. V3I8]|uniref:hypothetical protein n=1 Tax=Streptomyces sp. V3I8 TaxID=3042279 RepID=UPI0027853C37|nr:hypothetical protein [Streptomyces sp. V3I8]MDQ1034541.1 hypothetical protein [Streptomyces sp. V3I8]
MAQPGPAGRRPGRPRITLAPGPPFTALSARLRPGVRERIVALAERPTALGHEAEEADPCLPDRRAREAPRPGGPACTSPWGPSRGSSAVRCRWAFNGSRVGGGSGAGP